MKVKDMARIALSLILFCTFASAAHSQDAVPDTPPELRDFRLDPERPAPAPQPEVQPPPVAPTAQPEPSAPRDNRPAAAAQTRPSPPPSETPANPDPSEVSSTPAPDAEPEAIAEPERNIVSPSEVPAPTVEAPEPVSPTPGVPWWQIAAALAAALVLMGGWLIWRRRHADNGAVAEPSPVSNYTPPVPVPAAVPVAPAVPVPAEPAPPIDAIAKRPRITLEFVPEKATLGFSALTLKGQLHLVNEGDAPATDMQLRATMISANQRQKETIAAFHGGAIPIDPSALGNAKQGERLALQIEMAVQVSEIDSYTVGDQRIFVPVMLANVAYAWDGGADNITMACMVGRESDPPGSKMGPLRLDRGPRSFAPLGQRPLTT